MHICLLSFCPNAVFGVRNILRIKTIFEQDLTNIRAKVLSCTEVLLNSSSPHQGNPPQHIILLLVCFRSTAGLRTSRQPATIHSIFGLLDGHLVFYALHTLYAVDRFTDQISFETGGGNARPFDRYEPLLIVDLPFCHPTFYHVFLPFLFQVFLEAFALVSAAAELFPEIVFVAFASVADVAEYHASVDIALAFDVLVPVSVFVVEVDSSGCPRFFSFPNVYYSSSSSSSVEVVGEESVYSPTGVRTNYGLCSILSTLGPHQNKNLEHGYNKPSPGYNNVSDTNDLPMAATTNHSRKKCLHLYQAQRTHRSYQASLSHPEVPQIRWVAAELFQYLYLPLPLLE
jgi:hypothetical protein